MLQFLIGIVVKRQYKIVLICCRCNCYAQTCTFKYFFKWSKIWNL